MPKLAYPETDPSPLERLLFDADLVELVPLAMIYDIKARTSIQQAWQHPALRCYRSDTGISAKRTKMPAVGASMVFLRSHGGVNVT